MASNYKVNVWTQRVTNQVMSRYQDSKLHSCTCLKSLNVKCKCRELTTGWRFICPITAVSDGVTHPRVRDTLPSIAAKLVRRACTTRCRTVTIAQMWIYIHVEFNWNYSAGKYKLCRWYSTGMSLFLTLSHSSAGQIQSVQTYHRREDSHHCCLHSCCSRHRGFRGRCICCCDHIWPGPQGMSCQLEKAKIKSSTTGSRTQRCCSYSAIQNHIRKVDITAVFFFSIGTWVMLCSRELKLVTEEE